MPNPQTGQQSFEASFEDLAKRALDHYLQNNPQHTTQFSQRGRELTRQDFVFHFRFLADSLRLNEPALFVDHIAWTKVLLEGLNAPADLLRASLSSIREVVSHESAVEVRSQALATIDSVLASLPSFASDLPEVIEPGTPYAELSRQYLAALLEGDRRLASRLVLDAVDAGADIRDIYMWVFQRCQYEVGRLWQTNRISVAQEHFCTASTQMVMSLLYPKVFASERKGLRMVAACVGGDLHEIGLRMIADFFEMEGWDTVFMGANTPSESVVRMLIERQAHLLAVSVTMTTDLPVATELIGRVKESAQTSGIRILIGGAPFNRTPDLWRRVGADCYARDAIEAIAVARNMIAT